MVKVRAEQAPDTVTAQDNCNIPRAPPVLGLRGFKQNRLSQGTLCASLDPFSILISFQRSIEGPCLTFWIVFQPPDSTECMGNLNCSQSTGKQIPHPIQDIIPGSG